MDAKARLYASQFLTEQGKAIGGEFKPNQYEGYFLWFDNIEIQ